MAGSLKMCIAAALLATGACMLMPAAAKASENLELSGGRRQELRNGQGPHAGQRQGKRDGQGPNAENRQPRQDGQGPHGRHRREEGKRCRNV